MYDTLVVLGMLLLGHAAADFWMQSDALARMKNRHRGHELNVPPGQKRNVVWPWALSAHAAHHAMCVGIVLGPGAALAEFVAHWVIDFGKCEGWYSIHEDQFWHIFCKAAWMAIFL